MMYLSRHHLTRPQLIGFLAGPSAENIAVEQMEMQIKLFKSAKHSSNNIEVVAEQYDIAYQNQSAAICRDAGIIASIFLLMVTLVPNLTATSYSKSERLCCILLAFPLYTFVGMVGQILFKSTVPIEIVILKSWDDVLKSLYFIGYCSFHGLLTGLGEGESITLIVMHDVKVVILACVLVFAMVGVPSTQQKTAG